MGRGQGSAEPSLGLATAPCTHGDFTPWLPPQWTALSQRPFGDSSGECFIAAGGSSCPFCPTLTLLSPKHGGCIHCKSHFRGALLCFPGLQQKSHLSAEATVRLEPRARSLQRSPRFMLLSPVPGAAPPWGEEVRQKSTCCPRLRALTSCFQQLRPTTQPILSLVRGKRPCH